MQKKRMVGIDGLRLICAILILFFHLCAHGIDFKGHNTWIESQVEFIMILFFMISGFCLSCSHKNDFRTGKGIILFYKKRLLRLLPLYYAIEFYRLIVAISCDGQGITRFEMLPVRLLGIQMEYTLDVYGGVSWFIGSILACYFIYPLIVLLFENISDKVRWIICMAGIGLLFYSMLMQQWFQGIDLYYTTFFRILEFSIGAILPHELRLLNMKNVHVSRIVYLLLFAGSLIFISFREPSQVVTFIQMLLLPFIIIFASKVSLPDVIERITAFLSAYTFEIFLFQDVIFSTPINNKAQSIGRNSTRFYFFVLCIIVLSIIWKVALSANRKGMQLLQDKKKSRN